MISVKLLLSVFSAQKVQVLLAKARNQGVTEDEISRIMIWCAAFFGNMGNYKSFGDTKFVPDVPQDRLKLFLSCSCMNSDLFNTYFDATYVLKISW